MSRFCLFFLVVSLGVPAIAQERMPKIPEEKLTEAQKKAADEFRAEQQTRAVACRDPKMDQSKCTPAYFDIHGPMVPLLRSPEIMVRANALDNYLEFKTVLPPKLRELVILMAAREWTAQYVWNSHYTSALKRGLSPDIAEAVAEGRRPAQMADDEATVYDFFDELHRTHGVSNSTYTRALALVGEQGIVEMVSEDGYYSFLSMMMNVAHTPAPKTASAPPLAAFPR